MSKKHNHKERKEESNRTKFSKILTPEQKENFRSFGEPNMDQNWLELFTGTVMEDLRTIMGSCSDNQRKAEYVERELADYGFYAVGLGTNILTMANPAYPGVVFKIALDDFGVADNFNDVELSKFVPRYNRVFARDPSAMVSVQERLVLPTHHQMEMFEPQIIATLRDLSKYFLVADLSPDNYLNYGVTRDGDFRYIDGSDLYPLSQLRHEPRCNRIVGEHKHSGKFKYCDGKLRYNGDYSRMICQSCGKEFIPLEFRPRKDVNRMYQALSDGLTAEERKELERAELGSTVEREEDNDRYRLGNEEIAEMMAGMHEKTRNIFANRGEIEEYRNDMDDEDEDEEVHVIRPRSRWDEGTSTDNANDGDVEDDHLNDEMSDDASDDQEESEFENPTFVVNEDDDSEHPVHTDEDHEDDRDSEGFFVLRPRQAPLPTLNDPDPAEDGEDEDRVGPQVNLTQDEEDRSENAEAAEESISDDIRMSDEYRSLKEKILRAEGAVEEGDGDGHDTATEVPGEDSPVTTAMGDDSHGPGTETVSTLVEEASALSQEDAGFTLSGDPEIAQFQKLVAILKERQGISSGDRAVYRGLLKYVRGAKLRAVQNFVDDAKVYFTGSDDGHDISELEHAQFDQVGEYVTSSPKFDANRADNSEELKSLHGIIERQGHINESLLNELTEREKHVVELEHDLEELRSAVANDNDPTEDDKDVRIANLTERLTGLTAELQTARDSLDTYLDQLTKMQEAHDAELESVRADAEARLASLQTTNDALRSELDETRRSAVNVDELLRKNAGYELMIQQQRKENESLKQKIAQNAKMLNEASDSVGDDDYDQLFREKKSLELEVEELRAKVSDNDAVDTLTKELEELRVKNDLANKVISGESEEDARPDRAHYHVINDTGLDIPGGSGLYPGIYVDIRGDFDAAMKESGLSVFVGLGDQKTYYKAVDYHDMLDDLRETHAELVEDIRGRE